MINFFCKQSEQVRTANEIRNNIERQEYDKETNDTTI